MVKIITFEGIDYSGKTTALIHLAKRFSKRQELIFNEGLIYQDELTSRLLTIANQCNEQEKESLYTSLYILDTLKSSTLFFKDTRTFFQDRYWPSVIAYGKFLNGEKSIHNNKDFRPLFIYPSVVIHFTCSHSEKIRRSEQRERKSLLDKFLFENNDNFERLEKEIEKSLEGLSNIFKIDTTDKSIEEVTYEIENYLNSINILRQK